MANYFGQPYNAMQSGYPPNVLSYGTDDHSYQRARDYAQTQSILPFGQPQPTRDSGHPESIPPYRSPQFSGENYGQPQHQNPYPPNPASFAYSYNRVNASLAEGPRALSQAPGYTGARGQSLNFLSQSNTQSSPYHREPPQDSLAGSSNAPAQIVGDYTNMRPYQPDQPPLHAFIPSTGESTGKALASSLFVIPEYHISH